MFFVKKNECKLILIINLRKFIYHIKDHKDIFWISFFDFLQKKNFFLGSSWIYAQNEVGKELNANYLKIILRAMVIE